MKNFVMQNILYLCGNDRQLLFELEFFSQQFFELVFLKPKICCRVDSMKEIPYVNENKATSLRCEALVVILLHHLQVLSPSWYIFLNFDQDGDDTWRWWRYLTDEEFPYAKIFCSYAVTTTEQLLELLFLLKNFFELCFWKPNLLSGWLDETKFLCKWK